MLNFEEYQKMAARTINNDLSENKKLTHSGYAVPAPAYQQQSNRGSRRLMVCPTVTKLFRFNGAAA